MVSGHLKFTGIPQVDGLSTGPPDLRRHIYLKPLMIIACQLELRWNIRLLMYIHIMA